MFYSEYVALLLCHTTLTRNWASVLAAGDERSRLSGELYAELDLDAFRSIRKVPKNARHCEAAARWQDAVAVT
jgi:hypothetical protein